MKYTLYVWFADDDGGYGICQFGKFSPNLNYYPESGWRAQPSEKIGDFSTIDELAELLMSDDEDWYFSRSFAKREAEWLMENCYNEN